MTAVFAGAFFFVLCLVLLLNLVSLPANWIILALLLVWKMAVPAGAGLSYPFLGALFCLALCGEAVEFGLQFWVGKRFGSTKGGNIAGIVGSIAGAVLGAPFFFGFGAVPGALGGAFAGCWLMELRQGREGWNAFQAACGVVIGRFFGITLKLGIGVVMIVLAVSRVWPVVEKLLEASC